MTVPLGYFGVVELLRESGGGPLAGYGALAFLPVVWLALYRSSRGLMVGIAALFVSRAAPVVLGAGSGHAGADWRGVTLSVLIGAFIGVSIRYLVREVHDQAAEQDEQKKEIQRVGDLFAGVLGAATEFAIIATDVDGVLTVFNEGAERMLGYRAEDLIGVQTLELFHIPAEVLARANELGIVPGFGVFIHSARSNEPETREWTYLCRDGTARPVSLTVTPMYHGTQGEIIGFIGVAADISERKAIENARERLLAAERDANQVLGRQNDRLVELDHMKDEFVSAVSHDLRTPLTNVVANVEILADGYAGALNLTQQEMIGTVDRNAKRLLKLIENLLTLNQLMDPLRSFGVEIELGPVLASASEAVSPSVLGGSLDFIFECEDELGPVLADADQIERVILNLLSNAIKFTPPGGRVTLGGRRTNTDVVVTVSDTGMGIPSAEHEQVFSRFFRSSSTDSSYEGSGLGLTISKGIVENHNGEISVESNPGCGTTFTVSLPLAPGHQVASGLPLSQPAAVGAPANGIS